MEPCSPAGLVLLHCQGWRHYSSREGEHRATLTYLCGDDNNGMWAVRVAGAATTVAAALQG